MYRQDFRWKKGVEKVEIKVAAACAGRIADNIEKVIVGKRQVIELMLAALLAEGHVLLEDVPGTGKTMLSRALAQSLDMTFKRIQFTPDLLPSDITGLNFYNQKEGEFQLRKGPVFSNIVLADEINRATPRTQSSLLECMEERQVTIDGETCVLEKPFFVIATQNPVENAGTYPLPEAQLDRFMMKLSVGVPQPEEELQMMQRFMKGEIQKELTGVCSREEFLDLQKKSREVHIHSDLLQYIQAIVQVTRKHEKVRMGVSPRGTLALMRAVQAWALVRGRDYVIPEDIRLLAIPVLAHRMLLSGSAAVLGHLGGRRGSEKAGLTGGPADDVIKEILSKVPVPVEDWKQL